MIYQQNFDPFILKIDQDLMLENANIIKSVINVKNEHFLNNFLVYFEQFLKNNDFCVPDISLSAINEENISEREAPAFFRICPYVYGESETQNRESLSKIMKIISKFFYELFWQSENFQFEKVSHILHDIKWNQHFKLIQQDKANRFIFYNALIDYFIEGEHNHVYHAFVNHWQTPSLHKPENIIYKLNQYAINAFDEKGFTDKQMTNVCSMCLLHMQLSHCQRIQHIENAFISDTSFTSVLMPTDQVTATFFFHGNNEKSYLQQDDNIVFYGTETEAAEFLDEQLKLSENQHSIHIFARDCKYEDFSYNKFTNEEFLHKIYQIRTAFQESQKIKNQISAKPQILKRL